MKSAFGWIEVDNVRYDHDVIIHRDGTITKRSKKKSKELKELYGHTPLSDKELEFLDGEKPEIVWTGRGDRYTRLKCGGLSQSSTNGISEQTEKRAAHLSQ
jgi:hypothetical protein